MNRSAPLLCCALVALASAPCRADDGDDGAYGRLEGDLTWQADVGAALRSRDPAVLASLSARYLDTAGVYIAAYDSSWFVSKPPARAFIAGFELRPLFLPRFLRNHEHGPAWLDLAIDSLSLRVGAVFPSAQQRDLVSPGLEMGLQLGLPLAPSAAGPWLRVGLARHWPVEAFPSRTDDSAPASLAHLALSWQGILDAGLVDPGDRRQP